MSSTRSLVKVVKELERCGILLQQDKELISVVGLITRESLSTSWWNHPKAQEIFAVLTALTDEIRCITAKLIDGKVTFVAPELWAAVAGIGTANERWQLDDLDDEASELLSTVRREGALVSSGKAAKQLEARLLVHSFQRHTESGNHETVLESWNSWIERESVTPLAAVVAKVYIEKAAACLGAGPEHLPWHPRGCSVRRNRHRSGQPSELRTPPR